MHYSLNTYRTKTLTSYYHSKDYVDDFNELLPPAMVNEMISMSPIGMFEDPYEENPQNYGCLYVDEALAQQKSREFSTRNEGREEEVMSRYGRVILPSENYQRERHALRLSVFDRIAQMVREDNKESDIEVDIRNKFDRQLVVTLDVPIDQMKSGGNEVDLDFVSEAKSEVFFDRTHQKFVDRESGQVDSFFQDIVEEVLVRDLSAVVIVSPLLSPEVSHMLEDAYQDIEANDEVPRLDLGEVVDSVNEELDFKRLMTRMHPLKLTPEGLFISSRFFFPKQQEILFSLQKRCSRQEEMNSALFESGLDVEDFSLLTSAVRFLSPWPVKHRLFVAEAAYRFLAYAYYRFPRATDVSQLEVYISAREYLRDSWRYIGVYYLCGIEALVNIVKYSKELDMIFRRLYELGFIEFYIANGLLISPFGAFSLEFGLKCVFRLEFEAYDMVSEILAQYVTPCMFAVCRLVSKTFYRVLRDRPTNTSITGYMNSELYSSICLIEKTDLWLRDLYRDPNHWLFEKYPDLLNGPDDVEYFRLVVVTVFEKYDSYLMSLGRVLMIAQRDLLMLYLFLDTLDEESYELFEFCAHRISYITRTPLTIGLIAMEMRAVGLSWPYGRLLEHTLPGDMCYNLTRICCYEE